MEDSRFVEYAEVTGEGTMIIPQRVLDALELSIGDTVVFTVEDNVVYMGNKKQRVKAMESLFGCIPADITVGEAREERLRSICGADKKCRKESGT